MSWAAASVTAPAGGKCWQDAGRPVVGSVLAQQPARWMDSGVRLGEIWGKWANQNAQMWGISRQEMTQQMRLSGMPTLRKSLKR